MVEAVMTQETTLDRQSRLRERARQLREKREADRMTLVEKKYEQQFRYQFTFQVNDHIGFELPHYSGT